MLNFLESALKELSPLLEKHWEIDHTCFRTRSLEHYEETKKVFAAQGKLLVEAPVSGRPIATYELSQGINCSHGVVNLVEVPAPKPGRAVDEGYEHLEVVIDCSFEELMQKNPALNWDDRATSKEVNPELEAKFENFNVKFHHHALNHIIEIEKNELVSEFLPKLKVLQSYSPLISGTIPLGINTKDSDLDVLLFANDFDLLSKVLRNSFPGCEIKISSDYLVTRWMFKNLPIEFYAQALSPLKQNAHRHLRIEGRLLKLLGPKFKQKIIAFKEEGLKTEPAFGKVLELSSPYEDLLELYTLSDTELLQRFHSHCS